MNPTYGDYADPDDWGSDAGYLNLGGGLLRLTAGVLTLNGRILANGQQGNDSAGNGPGGSAGGIFIETAVLGGTGSITAKGGDGASWSNSG